MNRRSFLQIVGMAMTAYVPGLLEAAQLPDPYKLFPRANPPTSPPPSTLPSPSKGLPVNTQPAADLPSPSTARSLAERAMGRLNELTNTVQKNRDQMAQIQQKIARLNEEIAGLQRAKDVTIAELLEGLWCSQCGRPKSQIEREDREDFYTHLRRVNGRVVRAPQEKIDATAREFDAKIAAKKREQEAIEKDWRVRLNENLEAAGKIQEHLYIWRLAMGMEQELIAARGQAVERKTIEDIRQAEEKIAQADAELQRLRQRGALDKATEESLLAHRQFWENLRNSKAKDAKERISYYWEDFKQAKAQHRAEYAQVNQFLQRTEAFRNYLAFTPTLASYGVTWGPWSINVSADEAARRLKLGIPKVVDFGSLSVGAWQTGGASMEAGMALDPRGRFRARIGDETRYGPDGVEWTPVFDFGLYEDKPKAPGINFNLSDPPVRRKLPQLP